MILVRDLSYNYGLEPIFKSASFTVTFGSKVGLVGTNGSGKSTLFRILAGEIDEDQGRIEISGKVILVPQEVKQDEEMENAKTIREYLNSRGGKKEDYEMRRIMAGLDLDVFDLEHSPKEMSGGQKTRLAIARGLISEPNILLLDEPTNFLDAKGKNWVMQYVGKCKNTVIVVSHDLDLLDKDIDKVLFINKNEKSIEEYNGNYSAFVRQKEEEEALQIKNVSEQKKKITAMKKGYTKISNATSEKGVRQKLQLKRRIEAMEEKLPSMPIEAKKIRVKLPEPDWIGEIPLMMEHICKSYGKKKVLEEVNFDIKRGERIALVGENGAGKSTLIKIIMGMVEADSGEIISDEKLKIGYYSQEFETFDYNKTLIETLKEKCDIGETELRSQLGRFLFSGDKVFQRVGSLSGGEKTRLAIALLLVQKFNLLILDEPTTYLDVMSQRLILEALKMYKGAMIVVSHTPEFVEELNPERKFLLPENKMILSGKVKI